MFKTTFDRPASENVFIASAWDVKLRLGKDCTSSKAEGTPSSDDSC